MGRSRLILLIIAGLLAAVACGVVFFLNQRPLYQSSAIILINPMIPSMDNSPGTEIPDAQTFVDSEIAAIKTPGMARHAMDCEEYQKLNRPQSEGDVDRFLDHLDVARIPGTWFVQICYSDEDPTAAQAGVKAICRVSEDYHFGELVSAHDQMHIELLAEREQTFLDQRENLSKLLSNLSKQFVSPDLDSYQQEQIGWFNHLVEKEQESDLEDALSDLKAPTTVPTTRVDAVRARRQLFEEAILAQRTLLKNLDAQVEQFHELKAEIAADQQHIDSMRDQLEALDQRGLLISERVRFVSLPTLPTRPMPDSRRELAILGGVGAVQVIALFASIFAIARRQTRSWSAWVSLSASLILCACIVRLLLLGHMSHLFSTTSYGEVQLPPDPPDMRTPMPATPPQQFYR